MAEVIKQADLLEPLLQSRGLTIFAPNDPAILAASALIGALNLTQVQTVLSNHIINGTVVYSNMTEEADYMSAGGIPFGFSTNATGTFVKSGNNTARIIAADIPIANGVVHTIDRVLVNPVSNTEAAQSAASSNAAKATETAMATAAKGSALQSITFSAGVVGSAAAIFAGIFAGAAVL
ncbi:hypothetical protein QFC22_003900 [Naganishia vaughanmartiniae]|uniref:Uncharacterized protein n=1 Tax=Naganishia vaughanmartiniae TaxID=1424756 RepID=A0ACC2X5L6_9TREE|nr:hypothetical protein QFC22_003900 [Naganishia vaughanmartiniae]